MMNLSSAAFTAASVVAATVFSPSRNACVKRVAPSRFRYDPYSAPVLCRDFLAAAPAASEMMKVTSPVVEKTSMVKAASPAHIVSTTTTSVPAAAAASSQQMMRSAAPQPRFALVQFKHESMTFLAPFRIAAGDIVVVEGDRGENIGTVAEITKTAPGFDVNNKVIRRATEEDLQALAAQREREDNAVMAARMMADSLGLRANIEDAEYQFDGNKLTIFVRRATKNTFVDFRKLQRGLFREFRCRIWCAYMDEIEAAQQGPRCR